MSRCRGTTFVELMVVLTILVVAVGLFSRIVVATSRLRTTNRENAIAGEAGRVVLERMRGLRYEDLFFTYNSDPDDDPGGSGTAPGDRFVVSGLDPLKTAVDGTHGRILFPTGDVSLSALGEDDAAPRESPQGPGTKGPEPTEGASDLSSALREDCVYPLLGMPRDLNGDSIVDAKDHADDYLLLPVQIRIEWEGQNGRRTMDFFTMLTRFKKEE